MPRFFFDTYDGTNFEPDGIGRELENMAAVKAEAQKALPDMIRDPFPASDRRSFVVSVRNTAGTVVLRLALMLLIEDEPTPA